MRANKLTLTHTQHICKVYNGKLRLTPAMKWIRLILSSLVTVILHQRQPKNLQSQSELRQTFLLHHTPFF